MSFPEQIVNRMSDIDNRLALIERLEMPRGMALISESVLSSDTATVTFSSIPDDFKHLLLWISARGDVSGISDNVLIRFNSDSGSNYYHERLSAGGTTVAGAEGLTDTSINGPAIDGDTAIASAFSGGWIFIPHYIDTNFKKHLTTTSGRVADGATGNVVVTIRFGFWNDTSAITSITLLPLNSSNFKQNSRFALYGVY